MRWAELETAVERNAPDTESFLDTRSGEVITLVESAPNVDELRTKVMSGGMPICASSRRPRGSSTSGWNASSRE